MRGNNLLTRALCSNRFITYFCSRNQYLNAMPEVLRLFGLKFYIYTRDHEPPHVHVVGPDGEAKFLVGDTIELDSNHGLKNKDIHMAMSILEDNKDLIIDKWANIHGSRD